jgi:hypothetical protein
MLAGTYISMKKPDNLTVIQLSVLLKHFGEARRKLLAYEACD